MISYCVVFCLRSTYCNFTIFMSCRMKSSLIYKNVLTAMPKIDYRNVIVSPLAMCGDISAIKYLISSVYTELCCLQISVALHYTDVIMGTIASQITSLAIVYSTVYSDADQRKHHNSASLAFVWGIHWEFPAQMASNAENVSIWWRHHGTGVWRKALALMAGYLWPSYWCNPLASGTPFTSMV